MADDLNELKKDTTDLTKALRRLNETTGSAARAFGEFGAATGKVGRAWTIMSRITSGSGFWQIQNRIRSVSNVFELFTKAQDASSESSIKALEAGMKLNESKQAIEKTLNGNIKSTALYNQLLDAGLKPTEAKTQAEKVYKKTLKDLNDEIGKNTAKTRKQFKIDKSGLALLKERVKTEGVLAEALRPTKKLVGGIQDTLFGKKGSGFRPGVDSLRKGAGIRKRRGLAAQAGRAVGAYGNFSFKLFKGVGKFIGLGTLFFSKFLILGTVLSLVLGLLFFFLRQALPTLKEYLNGAFGLFKTAFTSIYKVIVGVYNFFKAIFEGRFIDAIKVLFKDILFNLVKAIASIIGGLVVLVVGTFISVVVGLGKTIVNGIKSLANKLNPMRLLGRQSGGIVNEGMTMVGENGPELVRLPRGSRVYSNANSKGMGGGTTNITVQVTGRVGASDMEIKDIARKVSREIGLQMNRTGSTAVRF